MHLLQQNKYCVVNCFHLIHRQYMYRCRRTHFIYFLRWDQLRIIIHIVQTGSGRNSDTPLFRQPIFPAPILPTAHCSDSPFLRLRIIPSKMVKNSIIIIKPVALFTKILTIKNCRKCKTKIKKSFTKILTIILSVKIVLSLRVKLPCRKCKILNVRKIFF